MYSQQEEKRFSEHTGLRWGCLVIDGLMHTIWTLSKTTGKAAGATQEEVMTARKMTHISISTLKCGYSMREERGEGSFEA